MELSKLMPAGNSTNKTPRRYRRFWRLFRREKPSLIDITYSYQYMMRFPRLPVTVPPLVPTLMSYRWNDEDDYNLSPQKLLRNHHHQPQHIRRHFSKRYSDIVGPSSAKVYLPRKASAIRESPTILPLSPQKHSRTSFKRNTNEGLYIINSHNKKSADILPSLSKTKKHEPSIVTRRYSSKNNKHSSTTNNVDLLAHRMQAAMSTELMHSLDRNFILYDKKQTADQTNINRSQSFHVSVQPPKNWKKYSVEKSYYYQIIPRVKEYLDDEQKSISYDEPTPDYEEEIIISRMKNDEIGEEPIADYDDSKFTPTYDLETSPALYDLEISSSCADPQTSITPNSATGTQDQSSIPPTPPPLPSTTIEQRKATFRCRTIADQITPNHKLILKDEMEIKTKIIEEKQSVPDSRKKLRHNPSIAPKPCYLHLSKELLEKTTLRKVSHPVSRPYSTYGSMSQLNEHTTEPTTLCRKTSVIDEQSLDGLSSSATTSIIIENEPEHQRSSKIYNDYKRRASLINVPTSNTLNNTHSHSSIIHPMHTHIGLRSSTSSSSTNDKPNEIILSNKQMNVCVINQLNQHLTTRFRKQQQQQQQDICVKKNANIIQEDKTNLYDEPEHIDIQETISIKFPDTSPSSIPPPPPPLPVGGFPPLPSQLNRPLSSQRTSTMTFPHESNSTDLGCNTGTSTTSSKLSDTRILRELRTNPLFAKAKQHLEIEPEELNESSSYFQLDKSSLESFMMRSDELNTVIDNNNSPIQCRQSELELVFQKRAQRNLT